MRYCTECEKETKHHLSTPEELTEAREDIGYGDYIFNNRELLEIYERQKNNQTIYTCNECGYIANILEHGNLSF